MHHNAFIYFMTVFGNIDFFSLDFKSFFYTCNYKNTNQLFTAVKVIIKIKKFKPEKRPLLEQSKHLQCYIQITRDKKNSSTSLMIRSYQRRGA